MPLNLDEVRGPFTDTLAVFGMRAARFDVGEAIGRREHLLDIASRPDAVHNPRESRVVDESYRGLAIDQPAKLMTPQVLKLINLPRMTMTGESFGKVLGGDLAESLAFGAELRRCQYPDVEHPEAA